MINFSKQNKHPVLTGLFFICLITVTFTSCTVTRPNSYFRDILKDTLITTAPRIGSELKIKPGDQLAITISSLDPEEDTRYNRETGNNKYEVSNDGFIHLHRLGKMQVAGLTRKQLKQKIEEGMTPYLKDPVTSISFLNHYVTVMGEIGKPQVLQMPEERMSLIEVLAQGGDASRAILLTDVLVIRDSSDTQKKVKHLNLEGNSVFASDYFYLQPNDVVVFKPDEKAIIDEKKRLKFQQISTITLQAVTLGLVVYQTFFRK